MAAAADAILKCSSSSWRYQRTALQAGRREAEYRIILLAKIYEAMYSFAVNGKW